MKIIKHGQISCFLYEKHRLDKTHKNGDFSKQWPCAFKTHTKTEDIYVNKHRLDKTHKSGDFSKQ